tara:strand:- start:450 stop:812 length:363 start_codon:yes stop_codon:yes gene_type:complete
VEELAALEPPWLDNLVNESCVPEGWYTIASDDHGRWQFVKLEHVHDRTGIEIHPMTTAAESDGCIALCYGLTAGGHTKQSELACWTLKTALEDSGGKALLHITSATGPLTPNQMREGKES